MSFASDLAKQRQKLKLSFREAAASAQTSPGAYWRAERGKLIDLRNFALLCAWLQKEPSKYLWEITGVRP